MTRTDSTLTDISAPVIDPKEGDVYQFVYSAESWQRAKDGLGHGDLRWCFDGQLVFRGGRFVDTYWGLTGGYSEGRQFSVAEAQAKGALTFLCNLEDVEKIQPHDFQLFADGDAFDLSYQHGCYKHFVKRKGARKDKALMLDALNARVSRAQRDVEIAVRALEYAIEQRERLTPRIEAGEEPYI